MSRHSHEVRLFFSHHLLLSLSLLCLNLLICTFAGKPLADFTAVSISSHLSLLRDVGCHAIEDCLSSLLNSNARVWMSLLLVVDFMNQGVLSQESSFIDKALMAEI